MKEIIIDFSETTNKTNGSGLFSGRRNGEQAQKGFKLNQFDLNSKIILKSSDESIIITNSYFLGLLDKVFKLFESERDLRSHIDASSLNELNKEELTRSIKRGFKKNTSLF